jgi:hypothetical protein
MNRRLRIFVIAVPVALVVALGGANAVFSRMGDDAPPPPTLAEADAATTTSTQPSTTTESNSADGSLQPVAGETTYVGYRVHEEFIGLGEKTAVGRTPDVGGTVTVDGDTITARSNDDGTVDVAGTAPIDFADFDIEAPSVGGFVTVEENGTLEFRLHLASA